MAAGDSTDPLAAAISSGENAMTLTFPGPVLTAALGSLVLFSSAPAQGKPADDLVAMVQAFLAKEVSTDWDGVETLPSIKWAAPTKMLQNCLPDGGCFTRQGTAVVGGKNLTVMVTGARTIVSYVYLRNGSAPFGEAAVLDALKAAGLEPELARCPVRSGAGGTNWYRLKSAAASPGVLSIQTSCGGRPCEGFVLSRSEELPPLQPNQVSLYSEQCAAGAERKAVSTLKPHQRLAEIVVALLAPASGAALYDWNALGGLASGVTWNPGGPQKVNYSTLGDPNPVSQSGSAEYAGRRFSVRASGTEAQVKTIHFEEIGPGHPRGEHMLGVVYEKGIAVRLVRCGPIYTESTNNWYSLQSPRTRPAMIRQSIGYDGTTVHDTYELRLDGSLPARDPRDRDPGVRDCR
jgi:hypothetical protein